MTTLVCLIVFVLLTAETPDMFARHWSTPMGWGFPMLVKRLPHLPFSFADLLLVAIGVAVLTQRSTRRTRVRLFDVTIALSILALCAATVWGALRGGDLSQVYFQLQGLIRLFLLFHVLFAVCRTQRDMARLMLAVLAAALYRAAVCVAFFFLFLKWGQIDPYPQDITGHDDSPLWAMAFVGLVCWAFATRSLKGWLVTPPLLVLLGAAINYNNRRLAWVEVFGGLAMLLIASPAGALRRRFVRWTVLAAPAVVLYISIGWEQPRGIFAPVLKLKSVLGPSEDDSSLSRDIENAGLVVTLGRNRLLGTGFGHEYDEVSDVYSQGMKKFFPQYRYIPHNSLIGLVAFTGALLFPFVWAPLPAGAFLAARAAAYSRTPRDRILSMTAFVVPFVYAVQAYGDMGLQALTANLLLAVGFAIAARSAILTGGWPLRRRGPRQWPVPAPVTDTGRAAAADAAR